jgi:hypothetical protein
VPSGAYGAPPPPGRPPTVGPPPQADPGRAVGAGLLNLSGLGLGYVLLRQWAGAAVCVAATAALLVTALPADVEGVPGWAVAGYAVLLVLAALDGARRGLRARRALPVRPAVAVVAGAALLAVPVSGVVLYRGAQHEAVEEMLLGRLAAADALVRPADGAAYGSGDEERYGRALDQYRRLAEEHAGSRAAKLVPDRIDAFYRTVAAPYEKREYCRSVRPLKYLRTVPDKVGEGLLGKWASWPDAPLATSLYECGMTNLGTVPGSSAATGGELAELRRTFPDSGQAARVVPAIRTKVEAHRRALGGGDPCPAVGELRRIGTTVGGLGGADAEGLAGETGAAVESGTYSCGVDQFRDKKFGEARATLSGFATTYRSSGNAARARSIAVAAEIAVARPGAGRALPATGTPGGGRMTYTVSNDSPGETVVLFTGPVTGSFTLPACAGCAPYPLGTPSRNTCKDSRKNYPKRTLSLPAGTYYFASKSQGRPVSRQASTETRVRPGYTYTLCTYTSPRTPFTDLPGLPGGDAGYVP